MKEIRVAIIGVGNCASNFVQGLEYYKNENLNGLMNPVVGGYDIRDLKIVAAFDIADNKVGKDISEAIYAEPNCTENICEIQFQNIKVHKGIRLDGITGTLERVIRVSKEPQDDIEKLLKETQVDVMVILLPTASKEACYFYSKLALRLGISVVNGIPVLISHDEEMQKLAVENKATIVGDDFKSQIGGAILHHSLMKLLDIRGIKINSSYQLNYAGNTDFLNLISRGQQKHESKKRCILSNIKQEINLSINVSYLENCNDVKTCQIFIEGENFAGCPITLETKLTVVDSANASGVLIDAIRFAQVGKERKKYGVLVEPSAFLMKSPVKQMENEEVLIELKKNYS